MRRTTCPWRDRSCPLGVRLVRGRSDRPCFQRRHSGHLATSTVHVGNPEHALQRPPRRLRGNGSTRGLPRVWLGRQLQRRAKPAGYWPLADRRSFLVQGWAGRVQRVPWWCTEGLPARVVSTCAVRRGASAQLHTLRGGRPRLEPSDQPDGCLIRARSQARDSASSRTTVLRETSMWSAICWPFMPPKKRSSTTLA